MIPKEKQSDAAFFEATYEATNRFIESGIIIKPAIQFLTHMLSSGKTCIISTASFHSAAEGFVRALINRELIEHYWDKIKTTIRKMMKDIKMLLDEAMENTLKNMSIV